MTTEDGAVAIAFVLTILLSMVSLVTAFMAGADRHSRCVAASFVALFAAVTCIGFMVFVIEWNMQ